MSDLLDDDTEAMLDHIDLDRLAIDNSYRRAVMARLKAQSEERDRAPKPAATKPRED